MVFTFWQPAVVCCNGSYIVVDMCTTVLPMSARIPTCAAPFILYCIVSPLLTIQCESKKTLRFFACYFCKFCVHCLNSVALGWNLHYGLTSLNNVLCLPDLLKRFLKLFLYFSQRFLKSRLCVWTVDHGPPASIAYTITPSRHETLSSLSTTWQKVYIRAFIAFRC